MVTAEFQREIDAHFKRLHRSYGDTFHVWLWIEEIFDALEEHSEFPRQVAQMRAAYHSRLHVLPVVDDKALVLSFGHSLAELLESDDLLEVPDES
jgi:hypothetical protein